MSLLVYFVNPGLGGLIRRRVHWFGFVDYGWVWSATFALVHSDLQMAIKLCSAYDILK